MKNVVGAERSDLDGGKAQTKPRDAPRHPQLSPLERVGLAAPSIGSIFLILFSLRDPYCVHGFIPLVAWDDYQIPRRVPAHSYPQ